MYKLNILSATSNTIEKDFRMIFLDYLIIVVELYSFSLTTRPSNRTDVDHSISKLNKGPSLHWQCKFGHVGEGVVDKLLKFLFPHKMLNGLRSN